MKLAGVAMAAGALVLSGCAGTEASTDASASTPEVTDPCASVNKSMLLLKESTEDLGWELNAVPQSDEMKFRIKRAGLRGEIREIQELAHRIVVNDPDCFSPLVVAESQKYLDNPPTPKPF